MGRGRSRLQRGALCSLERGSRPRGAGGRCSLPRPPTQGDELLLLRLPTSCRSFGKGRGKAPFLLSGAEDGVTVMGAP